MRPLRADLAVVRVDGHEALRQKCDRFKASLNGHAAVFGVSKHAPDSASYTRCRTSCVQIVFVGSDGQRYTFLAKPKDDLRKV